MKPLKIFTADSFTDAAFKGNPAGVCITEDALPEKTMQQIAMEMGLSETAFVTPSNGHYSIRYFSPQKEIALCGHATLAAAKIINAKNGCEAVTFITGAGVTLHTVIRQNEISMQFPVYDAEPAEAPAPMLQALGIKNVIATKYSPNNKIIMIEIPDAENLSSLQPDFTALLNSHSGINGVLVTAAASGEYDYEYRYFWPWAGTNEDPVTGGVQTFLAKYWSEKLNKSNMRAFQSSARTGKMNVALKNNSVTISGQAVIMLEGNLLNY